MRTLIVGDVHGCADELAELVDRAAPDRVVLVGDLFTKGPDPAGVWRLLGRLGARAVLGNHDDRLLQAVDGLRPDDAAAHRCIAALDAVDPGWLVWTRRLPLFLDDVVGFTVVHACVHPSGSLERTSRAMALQWRRWPDDRDDAPHWHRVYRGDRPIVFGHDARGGLVRVEKDGRPLLIGLDTGCVYGGRLSGYLPEQDRIVQVDARRAYRRI